MFLHESIMREQLLSFRCSKMGEGGKMCPAQVNIFILIKSLFASICVFASGGPTFLGEGHISEPWNVKGPQLLKSCGAFQDNAK